MSIIKSFFTKINIPKFLQVFGYWLQAEKERTKKEQKTGVPLRGLNAMPFRTEARKCNHWATGRLLE